MNTITIPNTAATGGVMDPGWVIYIAIILGIMAFILVVNYIDADEEEREGIRCFSSVIFFSVCIVMLLECIVNNNNGSNNYSGDSKYTISEIESNTSCTLDSDSCTRLESALTNASRNDVKGWDPVSQEYYELFNKPHTLTGYRPNSMETVTITYTLQKSDNNPIILTYKVDE